MKLYLLLVGLCILSGCSSQHSYLKAKNYWLESAYSQCQDEKRDLHKFVERLKTGNY